MRSFWRQRVSNLGVPMGFKNVHFHVPSLWRWWPRSDQRSLPLVKRMFFAGPVTGSFCFKGEIILPGLDSTAAYPPRGSRRTRSNRRKNNLTRQDLWIASRLMIFYSLLHIYTHHIIPILRFVPGLRVSAIGVAGR